MSTSIFDRHLPRELRPIASALSTLRAGLRLARKAELLTAFPPMALARFARDAIHRRSRNFLQLLHLHALAWPERPALVALAGDREVRLTYRELDERVNRVAHALARLGVGPGDRVALLVRNGHEYIEVNAALPWLGALAVQVGYRLKPPEIAYVLRNSGARALIFHGELAPAVRAAIAEGGTLPMKQCVAAGADPAGAAGAPEVDGFPSYEALVAAGDPSEPPRVKAAEGGGLMIYTSGTTGRPKGARRDYSLGYAETMIHFMSELPFRHDERHLVVCPLYHSAAPALVLLVYGVGGCCVIRDHFDPADAARVIARERITSTLMVPTMFARLCDLGPRVLGAHDLSSLRWVLSGAAPLPTELARRIEAALGPILYNFYGATETGFVTLARPGEHTARPGTIGRAVGGNEIRLLDDAGRDVPVGGVGELWVRNGMLMAGYHGDEAATRAAARDGFLSVGDLARRDEDGFYYLVDRKIDMVISGGVNIYPLEVEQRLHQHPAVDDVAVVGVPDAQWGEALAAFVVLRRGCAATAEELRAFVGEALADYKRPRVVEFVDGLPRTPTGKILKRELRERLAGGRA